MLLIGKSTDWLHSLLVHIFPRELFLESRGDPQLLGFFSWVNEHHFMILQPFSTKFSDCCWLSLGEKTRSGIQEPFPVCAFPWFLVLSIMSNFRITDLSKTTNIKTPYFTAEKQGAGTGTAGFSCWLYSNSLWPPASHFVPLCLPCSVIIGG